MTFFSGDIDVYVNYGKVENNTYSLGPYNKPSNSSFLNVYIEAYEDFKGYDETNF